MCINHNNKSLSISCSYYFPFLFFSKMFTLEVFGAQVVQIQIQIMACTKCRLKGSVPSTGEKNCQFLKISQNYEQLRLLQEETLENAEIPHSTSAGSSLTDKK